jgi:predicted 3-demethylubiquinone-9 3-methyltransferase (glyoxalase superfamily)
MQKITPFLWFNDEAEAAVKFYTSVFKPAKVVKVTRYGAAAATASGRPEHSVMTIEFELASQRFVALNGGPQFKFNEAVSFVVNCQTQREVDTFWKKLSAGGKVIQCGWLRDKYGVTWQIVPAALGKLLSGPDAERTQRVMQALLKMKKLDGNQLKRAYAGTGRRPSAPKS